MRVLIQRVSGAAVRVDGETVGEIGQGLLALVGVGHASTEADATWLAERTCKLRVIADDQGRMNRSVADVGGSVLSVSQFTLYGDTRKGRRPSFVGAAPPADGERLWHAYTSALAVPSATGRFGADMQIEAHLDGLVTLLLERESAAN